MDSRQAKSPLARYRQLSPLASIKVSPLCLGCMTFGDKQQEKYGKITKQAAFDIMDHFYKNGGNFFDTANCYQEGQSERWVGEWMTSRGIRDQIVLATKYSNQYKFKETDDEININYGGNGTKSMKLSIEASLKRLQTTYIDVLYIHHWDFTASIPELMHNLNDLAVAGKVLYFGISDTPAWIVAKANQYARDHGLRQFVVYQGMWNAAMRDMERDILPMALDEGMAIAPYGTLNQGRFQTKRGFEEREKVNEGRNFIPTSQHDKDVSAHLEKIADRKDTDLLKIALAYVMQKTPYVFPIVGGRKVEHIQGSIDGLTVRLTEEDLQEIEEGYHFNPGFPHTFLSGTLFDPQAKPRAATTPGEVWLTKSAGVVDFMQKPKAIGRE
ncbi:Aldo/keto reductase, partial [Aureobasidium melanogenum]